MKIKVKLFENGTFPSVIKKGDWIDLHSAADLTNGGPIAHILKQKDNVKQRDVIFQNATIPLGIAMQLPEGYEAIVAPRSSSFKNYGFMVVNSIGVIDNSYNGNDDQWRLPVVFFKKTNIKAGDRIAQFRIQLSQKATFWQKLKWLFSSKIEFKVVNNLNNPNRGGIGSTGK